MIYHNSIKIALFVIIIGFFALKNVYTVYAENIHITSSTDEVLISIPLFSLPLEESKGGLEEKSLEKNIVKQAPKKTIRAPQKQKVKNVSPALGEKTHTILVTAYSSTRAQTDSTPCITANGFNVCNNNTENVVATNFLPFGTKIRFPDHFGDRVFTVQDRMHRRYSKRIDVWMKSTTAAKKFGVKKLRMEIIPESLAGNF